MRAGKLNKLATLKRLQEGEDSYGGVTESWNDIASAWVGFIALRGSEKVTAIGSKSELIGTVFMRYTSVTKSLQVGDLIVVDGTDYRIESPAVNESLKNKTITVMVSVI